MASRENTVNMEEEQDKSGGKRSAAKMQGSAGLTQEVEKFLLSRLGETLQRKRLEGGFSQEQLCALTDMNRTYLSDIERGVSNASFLVLWKISTALKMELWQVLKEIDLSKN